MHYIHYKDKKSNVYLQASISELISFKTDISNSNANIAFSENTIKNRNFRDVQIASVFSDYASKASDMHGNFRINTVLITKQNSAAYNFRNYIHYFVMTSAAAGRATGNFLHFVKFFFNILKFIMTVQSFFNIYHCDMLALTDYLIDCTFHNNIPRIA